MDEILIEDGNGENYDILAGDETCEFDDENKMQLPGIIIQEVNLNNLNNTQSSQEPEKQDSGIEDKDSIPNSPTTPEAPQVSKLELHAESWKYLAEMEEDELMISKTQRKSERVATQYKYIFIGILTVLLVNFNLTLSNELNWILPWEAPQYDPVFEEEEKKLETVEQRLLARYLVKNLACTYRTHLNEMARNKNNSFEDLLEFHRLINEMSIESGGEAKDPYSWQRFDKTPPIKWDDNVFAIRHADAPKVKKDFLICLPPKTGISNWQIALAKLFNTKEEMAARGVILQEEKKNVFYPAALYGMVPRFHTVEHAALLEGKEERYLNTRDPFTRARSGWRDKIQHYPDDPAHDQNNNQFNKYVKKAKQQKGPPAPPKFKVSLEKWLRMLVNETNDESMNQHWKSQDGCCHFCAMDYEYILHGRLSEEEWPWVLDKQGLNGILELSPRYGGPDPESGWFTKEAQGFVEIPIDVIKELYRRYYFDFVAAGYSPKFVRKFISAVEEAQNNLR